MVCPPPILELTSEGNGAFVLKILPQGWSNCIITWLHHYDITVLKLVCAHTVSASSWCCACVFVFTCPPSAVIIKILNSLKGAAPSQQQLEVISHQLGFIALCRSEDVVGSFINNATELQKGSGESCWNTKSKSSTEKTEDETLEE